MKTSNANKVISVLVSVAMCPMMLPTAAFAAENDATSSAPSSVEQAQPADQDTGPSSDTPAAQPKAAGNTTDATDSEEKSAPATTTEKAEATKTKQRPLQPRLAKRATMQQLQK